MVANGRHCMVGMRKPLAQYNIESASRRPDSSARADEHCEIDLETKLVVVDLRSAHTPYFFWTRMLQ